MSRVSRNLLLLLAVAVVVAPLRAVAHGHSVRTAHDGHIHFHAHDHGGVADSHAHYHHHGEGQEEDPGDHRRVLDHGEPGPMIFWTVPAGSTVDAPPAAPSLDAAVLGGAFAASPLRRAKPPPRALHPHLDSVRTTILRV